MTSLWMMRRRNKRLFKKKKVFALCVFACLVCDREINWCVREEYLAGFVTFLSTLLQGPPPSFMLVLSPAVCIIDCNCTVSEISPWLHTHWCSVHHIHLVCVCLGGVSFHGLCPQQWTVYLLLPIMLGCSWRLESWPNVFTMVSISRHLVAIMKALEVFIWDLVPSRSFSFPIALLYFSTGYSLTQCLSTGSDTGYWAALSLIDWSMLYYYSLSDTLQWYLQVTLSLS